jgi:DNA polymerase III delta subunit
VTLAISDRPSGEVAKELGAHPFALSKLTPYVKHYDRRQLKDVIATIARADEIMKTSATDPWLCIENAMLTFCSLKNKN